MWALKAFLLGAFALGVVAYALSAILGLAAQGTGRELELAIGALPLVSVEITGTTTATTLGAGLAVVALVGGLANMVAALALRKRSDSRSDSVD